MQIASNFVVAIFCLCLLSTQMSGMHFHIDEDGQGAGIHTSHQHQIQPATDHHHNEADYVHNHSVEVDVSLPEQLSATWTKLLPVLIACIIAAILGLRLHQPVLIPCISLTRVLRRERWRPPLRAPPISL